MGSLISGLEIIGLPPKDEYGQIGIRLGRTEVLSFENVRVCFPLNQSIPRMLNAFAECGCSCHLTKPVYRSALNYSIQLHIIIRFKFILHALNDIIILNKHK